MRCHPILTALWLALLYSACLPVALRAQEGSGTAPVDQLYQQLVNMMPGTFSSLEQAKTDTNYLNVNLKISRIWPKEAHGAWFYVEQAAAIAPARPYLQRVYHVVEEAPNAIHNQVYKLRNAREYVQGNDKPWLFDGLSKDSLVPMKGCEMAFAWADGGFVGSIPEGQCPNSWGGASYVTSTLRMEQDQIVSFNRGWNAEGEQVWGPASGGYVLERIRKD